MFPQVVAPPRMGRKGGGLGGGGGGGVGFDGKLRGEMEAGWEIVGVLRARQPEFLLLRLTRPVKTTKRREGFGERGGGGWG